MYTLQQAEALIERGNAWKEALQIYDSLLTESEDDLRQVAGRALCLMHLERQQEALREVNRHLSRRRGWAVGWIRKAQILLLMGRYAEAEEALNDEGEKNIRKGCTKKIAEEARTVLARIQIVKNSGTDEHIRGNAAFARNEMQQALRHYRRALQEGGHSREKLAALHSNVCATLCRQGHDDLAQAQTLWKEALGHSEKAIALCPKWGRAYGRKGDALKCLGKLDEARNTYEIALRYDPSSEHVKQNLASLGGQSEDDLTQAFGSVALDAKSKGDLAFKKGSYMEAIKCYSEALGERSTEGVDGKNNAKLWSNRSACYAKLEQWGKALDDGQQALSLSPNWFRAWARVAAAMHGQGKLMDAYCIYSKGIHQCPESQELQNSAKNLLFHIPSSDHKFLVSDEVMQRFKMHRNYPDQKTRVFAISDVHIDQHGNVAWFKSLSTTAFQNDVVLVAGDIGDTMNALTIALKELKQRFRRVFMIPGNHDLWIRRDTKDAKLYPDSICKLAAMHNVCNQLNVDMGPAEVAEGIFIVPLFSWYNYQWDEGDPRPGGLRYDSFCKWPMNDLEVWDYMLKLNRDRLSYNYRRNRSAKIFSLSHFLPRTELPYPWGVTEMAKAVGCKELDLQIQEIQSDIHVFGHTHMNTDTKCGNQYFKDESGQCKMGQMENNTRYIQSALEGDGGLYCIWNGQSGMQGFYVNEHGKAR